MLHFCLNFISPSKRILFIQTMPDCKVESIFFLLSPFNVLLMSLINAFKDKLDHGSDYYYNQHEIVVEILQRKMRATKCEHVMKSPTNLLIESFYFLKQKSMVYMVRELRIKNRCRRTSILPRVERTKGNYILLILDLSHVHARIDLICSLNCRCESAPRKSDFRFCFRKKAAKRTEIIDDPVNDSNLGKMLNKYADSHRCK